MTGGQNGGPPRFKLTTPLEPPYIATARMFAASLARQFDLPEDTIEDLKLAMSEACARAVATGGKDGRLDVAAERRGDRLVFEVVQGSGSLAEGGEVATDSMEAALHLELIGALFDDAESVAGPDGAQVIRFSAA
ncbi:MAG TPA: ATP-binding protein [Actinomycetota bacterium]|nr:ATP-binding protein [Actinomycetota bacterium]